MWPVRCCAVLSFSFTSGNLLDCDNVASLSFLSLDLLLIHPTICNGERPQLSCLRARFFFLFFPFGIGAIFFSLCYSLASIRFSFSSDAVEQLRFWFLTELGIVYPKNLIHPNETSARCTMYFYYCWFCSFSSYHLWTRNQAFTHSQNAHSMQLYYTLFHHEHGSCAFVCSSSRLCHHWVRDVAHFHLLLKINIRRS